MLPLLLLMLAADPTAATFSEVKDGQVLFKVKVPKAGYWEFCLAGTKPAGEDPKIYTFAFAPVVVFPEGPRRVDGYQAALPSESRFKLCAAQVAGDQRLATGQSVEIRSLGQTKGPVVLRLTMREVKTGG